MGTNRKSPRTCCSIGSSIWLDANSDGMRDPLEPGTWVFILKQLSWIGGDKIDIASPIRIAEHPTVPIPAAAWLLGTGLIGLVVMRRKVKTDN